jgi:uncharacterized membrane protein
MQNRKIKNFYFYIVITVLSLLIIYICVYIKINKIEEGFTELGFQGNLPKNISLYQSAQFTFAIYNQEHKKTEYIYRVYIDSRLFKEGTISLRHNESFTLNCPFRFWVFPMHNPCKISVVLNKKQSIHFWVQVK